MYVGKMDISSIRLKFWLWFRIQVDGVRAGFRVARDSSTQFPLFLITHEQTYGISLRSE